MTVYLLYARSGREFEVEAELRAMGIDVWCGRVIRWKRVGKRRRPDPYEIPVLPNYLWAEMSPTEFYQAQMIKHLSPTMQMVPHGAERGLKMFRATIESAYQTQSEQVQKAQLPMPEFNVGETLKIIGGPFEEMVGRFRSIANSDDPLARKVCIDTDIGVMQVDPLQVERAG